MFAFPARLLLASLSISAVAVGAFAEEAAYPGATATDHDDSQLTFAAGGSSDVLARAVAASMSQ